MTADQKNRIVAILEDVKKEEPKRADEIDALIFAVRAVSPFRAYP